MLRGSTKRIVITAGLGLRGMGMMMGFSFFVVLGFAGDFPGDVKMCSSFLGNWGNFFDTEVLV